MTVPRAARHRKYGAIRTDVDGVTFDSKREAARYCELKMLERAKLIQQLELQPTFALTVDSQPNVCVLIGHYRADFSYIDASNGEVIVEDVKGFDVPLGRWKRKHTEAQYGITIRVVR